MNVGVVNHMAHKEQRQIVIRHVLAIRVRFVVVGVLILFILHVKNASAFPGLETLEDFDLSSGTISAFAGT